MRYGKFAFASELAVIVVLMISTAVTVNGQARQNSGVNAASVRKSTSATKVPRTLDGKPDLQGFWTHQIQTPLERRRDGKAEYTEEEAEELEVVDQQNRIEARISATITPPGEKTTDAYNSFWRAGYWTPVPVTILRSSQIVDPEDGRLPPLTPAAERRRADARERQNRPAQGPEDRPLWTRCIRGQTSGPPLVGRGGETYNANIQIVQNPNSVVIVQEMIHEAQIVPLDARPHLPQDVHLYKGNSRGHWEGDTLVIDSTNFRFGGVASIGETTEKLHVVERYSLLDADRLLYSFTVEDPGTWTKPWSADFVMPRLKDQKMLVEYACHEGNRGFLYQLTGARAQDEQPEKK
jgi:hypothetical protein